MHIQISLYLLLALTTFVTPDIAPLTDYAAYQSGQFGLRPNQTYYTSNVTSPVFLVNTWDKSSVDNAAHIFLNYAPDPYTGTVMFFSATDLSLVWYKNASPKMIGHSGVQKFQGKEYLMYWSGRQIFGHGDGSWLLLNSSYEVVYNITTAGLPVGADLHECRLTDKGTALITAYIPIPFNLTSVGGTSNDTLVDSVFQEVDIITGRALFTWHAIDHFKITDTPVPYGKGPDGWDWCHINSIQKTFAGHYVVSFGGCSMIVYINSTNGNPIWIMGGKKNQFIDSASGKAPDFSFQHHAVFHDKKLKYLTLFDNHAHTNDSVGCTSNCSTARSFTVDYATMSVSSIRQLSHPKGLRSFVMGNFERVDGENTLVNWGHNPAVTEHRADGSVALDIQFGVLGQTLGSYRAYKKNWVGYPTTDPTIVVRRQNASSPEILYVSWNGATEVKRWILLASASVNPLNQATFVDAVPRAGFETAIMVGSPERYIRAVGLDLQGEVLGMSPLWDRESRSIVKMQNKWQFQQM